MVKKLQLGMHQRFGKPGNKIIFLRLGGELMNTKNKILVFLLVLILIIINFDKKIIYNELPIDSASVNKTVEKIDEQKDLGTPACSLREDGFKNYASIMPSTGERVEIISVRKSKDVGIDVIYKVSKLSDSNAKPEGKTVEFINLFGSPVGFVLEN